MSPQTFLQENRNLRIYHLCLAHLTKFHAWQIEHFSYRINNFLILTKH